MYIYLSYLSTFCTECTFRNSISSPSVLQDGTEDWEESDNDDWEESDNDDNDDNDDDDDDAFGWSVLMDELSPPCAIFSILFTIFTSIYLYI